MPGKSCGTSWTGILCGTGLRFVSRAFVSSPDFSNRTSDLWFSDFWYPFSFRQLIAIKRYPHSSIAINLLETSLIDSLLKKRISSQAKFPSHSSAFPAPDIRIVDEARHELRDRYYKTGSGIELACVARPSCPDSRIPHPVWRKNGETLPDHVNVYHINGWAYVATERKFR